MNNFKTLTVISGTRTDPTYTIVEFPLRHGDRLTPKLARMAVRMAVGADTSRCTVWDEESGIGYRLYPNTARKLRMEQYPPQRGK